MRGGTARDESQSLGVILRRQCGELMIRESEDLLKCVAIYLLSTYGGIGVFALQEIGCGSLIRLPQFLFCRAEFFAPFSPFSFCFHGG